MTVTQDQRVIITDGELPTWDQIIAAEPEIQHLCEISHAPERRTPDGGFVNWNDYAWLVACLRAVVGWHRPKELGGPTWLFSNRAFDMAHKRLLG